MLLITTLLNHYGIHFETDYALIILMYFGIIIALAQDVLEIRKNLK